MANYLKYIKQDNTTYNVYDTAAVHTTDWSNFTNRGESYLAWGGTNISGDISPVDAACCDEFGHNKLAFLPASCITVEYSNDGGSSWTDYGLTDLQKTSLVTSECNIYIAKNTVSAKSGTLTASNCSNYKLRVTICSRDGDGNPVLYTTLKKILIYVSTSAATARCTVERQTIGDYNNSSTTWTSVGDYAISGWSGWNSIPYLSTFGGGTTQTTNPTARLRFTFYITAVNTSYSSVLSVIAFRYIGTTNWTMPSTLAQTGHLYTFDMSQNATFPSTVTASAFVKSGGTAAQFLKANGSVDSNTYLTSSSSLSSSKLDNSSVTIAGTAVSLGGSIAASTIGNALTTSAPAAYATSAGKATKDGSGNTITSTYAVKATVSGETLTLG